MRRGTKERGITIITLIVTIIIMLILAAVSINFLLRFRWVDKARTRKWRKCRKSKNQDTNY